VPPSFRDSPSTSRTCPSSSRALGRVSRSVGRRQDGAARHDGQTTEGPLVDEAQLATTVGEAEPDPQVHLVGLSGRPYEQLPAHAQVPGQRVAGVQGQPQVLTSPQRPGDGPACQQRREVRRSRQVPADSPRVGHLDAGDRPPDDAARETAPDHLDLGQLGH
jgi:hypothetical protein